MFVPLVTVIVLAPADTAPFKVVLTMDAPTAGCRVSRGIHASLPLLLPDASMRTFGQPAVKAEPVARPRKTAKAIAHLLDTSITLLITCAADAMSCQACATAPIVLVGVTAIA